VPADGLICYRGSTKLMAPGDQLAAFAAPISKGASPADRTV
jgi:hypothetical protein